MRWPWKRKHRHFWVLQHTSLSGWSIYQCLTCGKEDLG